LIDVQSRRRRRSSPLRAAAERAPIDVRDEPVDLHPEGERPRVLVLDDEPDIRD